MPVKNYEDVSASGGQLSGMMLIRQPARYTVWRPSINKGNTVFRPLPSVWRDDKNVLHEVPWRDEHGSFGTSFVVRDRIAWAWGLDAKFTCLCDVVDEDKWPGGSPCQLFHDSMRTHSTYKILFDRGQRGFPPLQAPQVHGLLRGIMIANAGKDYRHSAKWRALLALQPSAAESFDSLLNQPASAGVSGKTSQNDPYGWSSKYFIGDPVGCAEGKIFEWGEQVKLLGPQATAGVPGMGMATPGYQRANIPLYACRVWPDMPIFPVKLEEVFKNHASFEDLLWYMTGEEQINLCLLPGFRHSAREALLYVFGGKGVLPRDFEYNTAVVDMGPSSPIGSTQGPGTPAQSASSGGPVVMENDPFDMAELPGMAVAASPQLPPAGGQLVAPVVSLGSQPAQLPTQSVAQTAPVQTTSDAIRQRLAALGGKK